MIQKQAININFQKGLDLKTDPFQVQLGNFEALTNTVFDKVGRLTKRNGFENLPVKPNNNPVEISTFRNSLISIGNNVSSYEPDNGLWTNKGFYQPMDLSVVSLIRNNANQSQTDSALATNGLVCVAYTQTTNYQNFGAYYSILNSMTGQSVISPTLLPFGGASPVSPRVFALGNYFIVVYPDFVSSTNVLQYLAININTLITTGPMTVSNSYAPSSASQTQAFDGVVAGTSLFLAWNGAGSSGIKMASLSSALFLSPTVNPDPDPSHAATTVGVWADLTQSPNIIWVGYCNGSGTAYVLAVDATLTTVLTPKSFAADAFNITGFATNQNATIIWEQPNPWGYDASIYNANVLFTAVTQAGHVGASTEIRSNGVASKGFLINGNGYVVVTYGSQYQPSYFVVNPLGQVVAKFAYSNGGGFLKYGLPGVSVVNNTAQVSYLFKDLIQAVNKGTNLSSTSTNPVQTAGIYSQTGINLVNLNFAATDIQAIEMGNNLNISGGFLWAYDGVIVNENNFFLWPELQLNADGTYHGISTQTLSDSFTGTVTSGSNLITSLSGAALASVVPGVVVSGTDIPTGSYVLQKVIDPVTNGLALQISQPATGTHSGETVSFVGGMAAATYYYQFTYEWTDNQGNAFKSAPSVPVSIVVPADNSVVTIKVPNLNLTYKTTNPVKIVGYRWSTNQEEYFQFTSITQPVLNSPSLQLAPDIIDASSDAAILGNNLIYVTGGVIENISPPATSLMALFDDRLWLVDAEDTNLLWFSKQVIEATPLEMSDLFTVYVAPTTGSQKSTGPVTSLFPMDDKLSIFSKNAIRYINGTGPDNTGSNSQYSQPIFITSPVGCANQSSLTMVPNGQIFQSDHGLWLLDHSLQVTYIGAEVEAYNQYTVTSATTIPGTTQVRFSLNNGLMLVYDYFVGQWSVFSGTSVISSCVYNGLHTTVNPQGIVSQETPGQYLDNGNPVLLGLTTSWLTLAGLQGYQRAFQFFLLGQYYTPFRLQCSIAYDFNSSPEQGTLISPTNYSQNYGGPTPNPGDGTDSEDPYGQGNPYGGPTNILNWRVFLTKQRCQSFQISLQEVYDPSLGVVAGAGFTLSGLQLIVGIKRGYRTISSAHSIGGGTR